MRARVERPPNHENLTLYENLKKSKKYVFVEIFVILVIFEFFEFLIVLCV